MSKEGEYRNFKDKPEYDFKFDWAVGRKFELRISVDSEKLRIRTEITSSNLPSEGGEENKPNENNQE
jgi:hypothetical protein